MSQQSGALDLRLQVPALVGWAFTASVLGWTPTSLAVAAGVCAVLAASLVLLRPVGASRGRRAVEGDPRVDAPRVVTARSVWSGGAWWRGPASRTVVALSLAAVSLVGASTAGHLAARSAGPLETLAGRHAVVSVMGVVATDPTVRTLPGRDAVMVRFRLTVTGVTARGERSAVRSPILVLGDERWQDVRWREAVTVKGKLVPAEPGDDVIAVIRPSGDPVVSAVPGALERAADHLRAGLREAASPLPTDARGLLPALVIGDTSRTPTDLTEAMLATGMTHLSAVSGSNVAIVLAFALGGAGLLGVPRRWRPVVAGLALAGFVVLARPEPSVIRAATMGAIGLIGLSRSRRAAGIPVLSAAVLVLLVVDPWLARSYGFALSTLATLGLLLFTRSWGAAIGRRLPGRLRSWGPAMAIPVAAQAMCAPVVVLLQGSVSVVGVFANLLAAPLVAPATVSGVAAALLAPLWPWGATALCWMGALPTEGIAWVARTCGTVPGGTMPWPDGASGAVLLTVVTVAVIASARWWVHTARVRPVAVISAVLLVVGAAAPTSSVTWPAPGWRFVACDVGQGDGLVLATTPGHAVLVDAGPDPAAIDGCLRGLDVEVLDSVVLTHFHADHVDGLPGAIAGREVREVLATPVHDPDHQWKEVTSWTRARGIPLREVVAGDHLAWPGVTADVWWPQRRISSGSVPNNSSVVLAVRSGPVDLLLLGDVEREAAHAVLLELRRDPAMSAQASQFDVLKVAHHGSGNLDEDLMAVVAAPIALISVGKDNDYGHPSPKALDVLRRNGSTVFRTDQRGDVAVVAEAGDVGVTWRRR